MGSIPMKTIPFIVLTLTAALVTMAILAGGGATAPEQAPTETRKTNMSKRIISGTGYDITPLSEKEVAVLAAKLDPETFRITQKDGTERPFCGTLLDNKKDGTYCCVVCGLPLFSSKHKFTSGTGWPSFYQEYDEDHVRKVVDRSHGMVRTEIECARCGAHLGHVFDDGPEPTGMRHCLNSASLVFVEEGMPLPSAPVELETAYFAGGCFWGIEHYFQAGPGVVDAVSGYMQGETKDPTYKEICSGNTGHAEAVKVVYDPKQISYGTLLKAFFLMHDPTQLNRQGPDRGTQYRSGVYATDAGQLAQARAFVAALNASDEYDGRVVTEVETADTFYPAEDYHQDYIETTGRSCHVTNPWPTIEREAKESQSSERPSTP